MARNTQDRAPVDFQVLFDAAPEPYLVLDPHFVIVAANDAYLKVSLTSRDDIVGRYIFDVFPDNPENELALARANITASLRRVLETRQADTMAVQRYDIPKSGGAGGDFEERFWSPVNAPVLDEQGEVAYIVHRPEDVTDFMHAQEAQTEQAQLLEERTRQLEVEMFNRAKELQRLNSALRDANARRDLVLDSSGDAIVALDRDWRITYVNDNAVKRIDADREELIGRFLWELYPNEGSRTVGRQLQEAMELRRAAQFDYFSKLSQRWTENRVYPSPEGLVLFSTDVTQRKDFEAHLEKMRARLDMAMRVARLGFWEMDLQTQDVYFSPECRQQLGYEEADWPDTIEAWRSRVHPDDLEMVSRHLADFEQGTCTELNLEYRLAHRRGDYRWIYARFMSVTDGPASNRLMVTHLDVTERKQRAEQMRRLAQHDALTDLPNRALIYDYTERLIARKSHTGGRFAMLFLDLDRFKPINDRYGHKMGDTVLKTVSERLASSVRTEDLVGRLAGDEFIVVLPDIDCGRAAANVAKNISERMAQPYQVGGYELRVTPSVGISLFPQDGGSVDELIHAADTAMYEAKEGRRNSYQFIEPTLHRSGGSVLAIEEGMRRSLECQEFKLFYQPILDTQTQAIVAVEALLRWFPDGVLSEGPDVFIPVAETSNIIKPLGDWVFREACEQHLRWVDQGLPAIPIAINVSPVQLLHEDFYDDLAHIVAETSISPDNLLIELTETAAVNDTAGMADTLRKLRELGIKIMLDDFGTGHSSLSYLRQLPVDILKIDKSFAEDVQTDANRAIVETILFLGRTLELGVIAAGIQSESAYQVMQERGCPRVQGYFFCEPLAAEDFSAWYGRTRGRSACH